MYEVIFSPKAREQYLKLEKETQRRISAALRRLVFSPERYVKKLVGFDAHRFRVGDYRLILNIKSDKQIILMLQIGHRKNIYKKL